MKWELKRSVLIGISLIGLCSILACVERDRVVTASKTQSGENWVKSESVQEYRGDDGKMVKEKQYFSEKTKCVRKNGEKIAVDTVEECLKRGGKIVDVIVTDEETFRYK